MGDCILIFNSSNVAAYKSFSFSFCFPWRLFHNRNILVLQKNFEPLPF